MLCEDFWFTGHYKESKYIADTLFYLEKQELNTSPGNKDLLKEQAYTYNNLAIIYRFQGNYSASIDNHLKALKIRETINDVRGIARSNLGLGTINEFLGKKKEALVYKLKAKALFEQAKDTMFVAITNNHIASIYFDLGNINEAEKHNSMAILVFIQKSNLSGTADAYMLAGQIFEIKKEYADAIDNYKGGLIYKEFCSMQDGVIDANVRLGKVYTKLNQLDKAKKHLNDALILSNKLGSKINQSDIYKALTTIDSISHDYAAAYQHYKLHIAYRDSLINQKSAEKISQLQAGFENQKIEEIKALQEEKKEYDRKEKEQQQKVILYSISAGLLIVLVFTFFIFRSYKLKQKINNELIIKNDIIEKQKHLVEEKQTEILDSINYAKRIQYSLLASEKLLNENLKDYFLFFKPKDVVSGDFYWGSKLNNSNFILVTADSTGHGVPGAIMSMLNISCLNEAISSDKLMQPADILNASREKIITHLSNDGSEEGGKDGMDCSLISFDFANKKLAYSAANNPIWIIRKNSLIALPADRMPVGKHNKDNVLFTQHQIELQTGDMVYTLTDGFPDQFGGPKGKKYKYKQLEELLISIADKPTALQKQLVSEAFDQWKGTLDQVDDITIIGIRV
ncbi:MAG: tetratricopeptide repeat protein [Bacteroidota bacterium]